MADRFNLAGMVVGQSPEIGGILTTRYRHAVQDVPESDFARLKGSEQIDTVRAHLAKKTIAAMLDHHMRPAVVDGGSNQAFLDALPHDDIALLHVPGPTQSHQRNAGMRHHLNDSQINTIAILEPEKHNLVPDLALMAERFWLVRYLCADILVPNRLPKNFDTFPTPQAEYEQMGNEKMNGILKQGGWMDQPDYIDFYYGPMLISLRYVKRHRINELMEKSMQIATTIKAQRDDLDTIMNHAPMHYFKYLALQYGWNVKGVPVDVDYDPLARKLEDEWQREHFSARRTQQKDSFPAETAAFVEHQLA